MKISQDLADQALSLMADRGSVSSAELQQRLGKSQPTVSRLLQQLGPRVAALGRGKAARYGQPLPILGRIAPRQPLWHTDAQGRVERWATLTWLAGGYVHIEASTGAEWLVQGALPWFLAPFRLEGFLGRLQARSPALAFLGDDPQRWTTEQVLYAAATQLQDLPGAFTLGDTHAPTDAHEVPLAEDERLARYDDIAAAVAAHLPAGSSAGGEQPKFLARLSADMETASGLQNQWASLIVKFTPPRGTPFGERWNDLLQAEATALAVMAEAGEPVARARVIASGRRTYLESLRFDRFGFAGRRHAVPLLAAHEAFVDGPLQHWGATCDALAAQGRLSAGEARRVRRWRAFGQLIGNSDMHFGNLGLWADNIARGRFSLAPCYDMLPMRYKPEPLREDFGLATLALAAPPAEDSTIWREAAAMALSFWQRMSGHPAVSAEFRELAGRSAEQVLAGVSG